MAAPIVDATSGWSATNTRAVPKSAPVSGQVKVTVANDERGQYYITEQSIADRAVPRHNSLEDHAERLEQERNAVTNTSNDPINRPSHYTSGGIETIDFIEAKGLNYNLGNVVKYVSRAGKKFLATDTKAHSNTEFKLQDLEKAFWYLQREIETLKGM